MLIESQLNFCISMNYFQNKNSILVAGAGVTGKAVIEFLKKFDVQIYLYDERREEIPDVISFQELNEEMKKINFSLIIKSPGIKPDNLVLKFFRNKKIPIRSEIEIARSFFKGKIIGITGTDGKSTTTALAHHIIQSKFPKTKMGGNIGFPFISFCQEDLNFAVLELSSYQLEDSDFLDLDISAFLNLATDHLERHKTMENYREAKKKIINRKDKNSFFIVNEKLKPSLELEKLNLQTQILEFGFKEISNSKINFENSTIQTNKFTYSTEKFSLQGLHNLENLAATILIAELCGVEPEKIHESYENFSGLLFRFQRIKKSETKEFINDSKSTNIHSLLSGIAGVSKSEKILLILGGKQKGESLEPLIKRLVEINVEIILFGEARDFWEIELKNTLNEKLFVVENLEDAIQKSTSLNFAKMIFSPACASFDQYQNFEERGRHFNSLIEEFYP